MTKLLVTTDFSTNSKAGIRFGFQFASQTSAEIDFFHVIEITKPTMWNEARYKSFAEAKILETERKLKTYIAQLVSTTGPNSTRYKCTVEIGNIVSEQIIKRALKIKADYVCMSTHGAGNISKVFGTHASTLVTSCPTPLIVVPKGYRIKPVKTIFYASDFANLKKELKIVEKFALLTQAKIEVYHFDYLLHVEENLKNLEAKTANLRSEKINFNFKRLEIEYTLSQHLDRYVAKLKPQVLVLFSKLNRNWYERLFYGSKVEEVSFNSKTPLLVFRKQI